MTQNIFFDNWEAIFRGLVIGVLAYFALIICLRLSGKRTLSKWNIFDFIVTIALGSALAAVILTKDITLSEGVLALGLLVGLQFVITWLSVRSDFIQRLIKTNPTLLFEDGEFICEAMRQQRVTESEIRAAIRSKGMAAIEDVAAVVLETDGTFSVIKKSFGESRSALQDVIKK